MRTHASDAGAAAAVEAVRGWLAEPDVTAEDVAVLARVQSLLLAPHVALAEAGVPVDSILDEGVLTRLGVRAALAYLRIAVDPDHVDGRDLSEVHRRPSRGLPQWATKFLDRCRSVADVRRAAARIDDVKVAAKLDDLAIDLDRLATYASKGATARELLTSVRDDIGLGSAMTLLDSSGAAAASHLDDLEALLQVADLHPDASSFEAWLRGTFHRERADGGVTLSTIHRVKGLEWDRVVVFGVSDGIVPHRLAEDVEEERRVLHVGITRGRHRVLVLGDAARPSRCLAELAGTASHEVVPPAPTTAAPPPRRATTAGRAPRRARPRSGCASPCSAATRASWQRSAPPACASPSTGADRSPCASASACTSTARPAPWPPPPSPLAAEAAAALAGLAHERAKADRCPPTSSSATSTSRASPTAARPTSPSCGPARASARPSSRPTATRSSPSSRPSVGRARS